MKIYNTLEHALSRKRYISLILILKEETKEEEDTYTHTHNNNIEQQPKKDL